MNDSARFEAHTPHRLAAHGAHTAEAVIASGAALLPALASGVGVNLKNQDRRPRRRRAHQVSVAEAIFAPRNSPAGRLIHEIVVGAAPPAR